MDEKLTKDEKKQLRQQEWREKADSEQKKKLYQTIGWWAFGGLLLVLAIWALVVFSKSSSNTSTSAGLTQPPVTASDFQTNPTGAKVTLVEYADFQCPACKAYFPVVQQLEKDYGTKLNLVYRMFPLKTVHQNAVLAAQAAYAANKQGKFWEMHDQLFETQDDWGTLPDPESVFIGYAKSLGLNTDTFKKDYEASTTSDFVNNSYDSATNIGLDSTPTFFVNGIEITNPNSYADFKALIDKALK